jgi:hypothetical protein
MAFHFEKQDKENKAKMAEPIQGDEENLLQSRSKIKKIKHRKTKPMKTMRRYEVVSGLHDDATKRATTHSTAAIETASSRVFTRSCSVERITTTTPTRGLRHPHASPPLALMR